MEWRCRAGLVWALKKRLRDYSTETVKFWESANEPAGHYPKKKVRVDEEDVRSRDGKEDDRIVKGIKNTIGKYRCGKREPNRGQKVAWIAKVWRFEISTRSVRKSRNKKVRERSAQSVDDNYEKIPRWHLYFIMMQAVHKYCKIRTVYSTCYV